MADHKDHPTDEVRGNEPVHRDETVPETRGQVVSREREEHGGIKIGSAFFGWLAATGMAVLLSGLVAATGLFASEASGTDTTSEAAAALDLDVEQLGVAAIVVALVIWFVAYFCGGYVAGRMARFDGLKQGLGVWLWAIVVAVVLGGVAAVAGVEDRGTLALPQVSFEDSSTGSIVVAAVVVMLVALVGAMLGGLAGMRFHRRVDRTGLG